MAEDVDVSYSGPMFDGRAQAAGDRMARDMTDTLGKRGKDMVLERLGEVIRHPTGYYESQVRVNVVTDHEHVVTDGGVVYGPWLEGTSSRNETTRFKGYHTFRVIGQRLEAEAEELTRADVERATLEMEA